MANIFAAQLARRFLSGKLPQLTLTSSFAGYESAYQGTPMTDGALKKYKVDLHAKFVPLVAIKASVYHLPLWNAPARSIGQAAHFCS